MYKYFACLSVSMFVSNKGQNDQTDWAQLFYGNSHDPREGIWTVKVEQTFFKRCFCPQDLIGLLQSNLGIFPLLKFGVVGVLY